MESPRPFQTLLAPVLLATFFLASCGKEQEPEDTDVLARIGGQTIRLADFEREWDRRRNLKRPIASKEALLEEMVAYQVLLEQAKQAGIDRDPEVQRAISNLLIGKLKERELTPALQALSVTEEELEAAYTARSASLQTPEMRRLSIIHVKSSSPASARKTAELKARIEEARDLAMTGENGFSAAAAKFSDDQASRYRKGDIGWTEPGKPHPKFPPEAIDAGHALAADGDLSAIVETSSGFFLVKRIATKSASVPPLAQIADRLRAELLQDKRETTRQGFEQTMQSSIEVVSFPERLSTVQRDPASPPIGDRPPQNP